MDQSSRDQRDRGRHRRFASATLLSIAATGGTGVFAAYVAYTEHTPIITVTACVSTGIVGWATNWLAGHLT